MGGPYLRAPPRVLSGDGLTPLSPRLLGCGSSFRAGTSCPPQCQQPPGATQRSLRNEVIAWGMGSSPHAPVLGLLFGYDVPAFKGACHLRRNRTAF